MNITSFSRRSFTRTAALAAASVGFSRGMAHMKSLAHWTPSYAMARSLELINHKLRPDDPWLTREAVNLLARLLRPTDEAIEFGSGRSTLWFAARIGKITSVESNEEWYNRVRSKLADQRISNVTLRYCPRDIPEGPSAASAAYVRVLDEFADESIDFVLVDGIYRNHCAAGSLSKMTHGGLIVIDNVNWYLPSESQSPNSRTLADGPADAVWRQFADATADWRRIWSTSGVWDTLILFKP